MATFTFAPSAKKVSGGIEAKIEYAFDRATGGMTLEGKVLGVDSLEYLACYGLKQCLADSYASAKDQVEFDAMLAKRIDKLIAGTMSVREGGKRADPFEAECVRFAKAKLAAIAKARNVSLPKMDTDEYKALLAKVRNGKAKEQIEADARASLEALAKASEGLDDDDDLFDDMDESEEDESGDE